MDQILSLGYKSLSLRLQSSLLKSLKCHSNQLLPHALSSLMSSLMVKFPRQSRAFDTVRHSRVGTVALQ